MFTFPYKENLSLRLYKFKRILLSLYFLNLLDLLFTKILLKYGDGLFLEANYFLAPIIHSSLPYLLKIIVFPLVLIYWYNRIATATEKEFKLSMIMSILCLILYILINIAHIFYFFLMLYFK